MPPVTLATPLPTTKAAEFDTGIRSILDVVKLDLDKQDPNEIASFISQRLRPMMKEVAATFDPLIHQAHKMHQGLLGSKRKYYDPLMKLERELKQTIERIERSARDAIAIQQKASEEEGLPSPLLAPEKPKNVTFTVRHRWSIVDVDKVGSAYKKVVPDEEKIATVVAKYGTEAARIVGGIVVDEYRQVAVKNGPRL